MQKILYKMSYNPCKIRLNAKLRKIGCGKNEWQEVSGGLVGGDKQIAKKCGGNKIFFGQWQIFSWIVTIFFGRGQPKFLEVAKMWVDTKKSLGDAKQF